MKTLTLREKVAQLIFIPFHGAAPNSRSREYRQFMKLVRETRVGGMVLVNWNNGRAHPESAARTPWAHFSIACRSCRACRCWWPATSSGAPPCAWTAPPCFRRPWPSARPATRALARFEGQVTAREARAIGVQWLFFPVADVNNNPDNPIINIRSYGEDPKTGIGAGDRVHRGHPRRPALSRAHHRQAFPGHGDTAVDTHLNMAVIDATREHLESVELPPFPRGHPGGRGCHHDRAYRGARAGPRRCARHALARHPDRPSARRNGIQGHRGHRRAGDGRHRAGLFGRRSGRAGAGSRRRRAGDAARSGSGRQSHSGRHRRADASRAPASTRASARLLAAKERMGLDRRATVDLEAIGDQIDMPEDQERAQDIASRARHAGEERRQS